MLNELGVKLLGVIKTWFVVFALSLSVVATVFMLMVGAYEIYTTPEYAVWFGGSLFITGIFCVFFFTCSILVTTFKFFVFKRRTK